MNGLLTTMMLGMNTSSTNTQASGEAVSALEEAQRLASEEEWSKAIDAYTVHLSHLSTRHYRDKKTYEWILMEYKGAKGDQLDSLSAVVQQQLKSLDDEHKELKVWRLHQLLVRIAEMEGNADQQKKQLQKAIQTYPVVKYSEPEKHSKIQHLYNELGLIKAEKDIDGAEEWFLDGFVSDTRFGYVCSPPWQLFFKEQGLSDRYEQFLENIRSAVDKKMEKDPSQGDYYRYLKTIYASKKSADDSADL